MRDDSARNPARPLWFGLAATVAALVLLVVVGNRVSSGFRLNVLETILKAGWAGTAAILASGLATAIVRRLSGEPRAAGGILNRLLDLITALIAFVTALVTLGYFMPGWDAGIATCAGIVAALWALAAIVARFARSDG
jgi:hypothetical protein